MGSLLTKSYPILLHSSPADTEHLTSKCYKPLLTRRSLPLQTRQDLIKLLFPLVEMYLLGAIKGTYSLTEKPTAQLEGISYTLKVPPTPRFTPRQNL